MNLPLRGSTAATSDVGTMSGRHLGLKKQITVSYFQNRRNFTQIRYCIWTHSYIDLLLSWSKYLIIIPVN